MSATDAPFPALEYGNAAVIYLRAWIKGQRELARIEMETATDINIILRLQGRAALLAELEKNIDPAFKPYGGKSEYG